VHTHQNHLHDEGDGNGKQPEEAREATKRCEKEEDRKQEEVIHNPGSDVRGKRERQRERQRERERERETDQ
jgi:hypothetical protein